MHVKRSFFAILGLAAALCLAASDRAVIYVVDRVESVWRRITGCVGSIGSWLIARIPKAKPDWLGALRRSLRASKLQVAVAPGVERRPLVSTRWRMCPST